MARPVIELPQGSYVEAHTGLGFNFVRLNRRELGSNPYKAVERRVTQSRLGLSYQELFWAFIKSLSLGHEAAPV